MSVVHYVGHLLCPGLSQASVRCETEILKVPLPRTFLAIQDAILNIAYYICRVSFRKSLMGRQGHGIVFKPKIMCKIRENQGN